MFLSALITKAIICFHSAVTTLAAFLYKIYLNWLENKTENGVVMLRSYENYIHINIIVWDKLAFAVVSVQLVLGERKQGQYSKSKQSLTNLTPDDATFAGFGNRTGNLKPIIYKRRFGKTES